MRRFVTASSLLLVFIVVNASMIFLLVRDESHDMVVEPVANSMAFLEIAAPTISSAGGARIYMDSTSHSLQASVNGAAYTSWLSGSGANTQVTYYTAAGVLAGDAGFVYNASTDTATLAGALVLANGTSVSPSLRWSDADTGIFLDPTNPDIDLSVNGAVRAFLTTAAFQTQAGTQMISLGGDSGSTPNFQVEAGEGLYDCGTNCVAIAANTVDVLNADATDTLLANDDTVETITDTGSNGNFAWALDGTLRLTLQTGGHITSAATATTNAGTGTCTAITVAGNDVRGTITATCTAGQTVIMNFGTAYAAAPNCTIAASDPDAVTAGTYATTTTGALTLTANVGVAASQIYKYICIE